MGKLTLHIITNQTELENLHEAWNNLLIKSNANTVFLTWEWMYTWWECFGEGKKLFVVVAEDKGVTVGIAPFQITQSRFFGICKLSLLEFLGTTGVITEYPDIIIQQGREYELIPAIIDFILKSTLEWDVLNLVSIRQSSQNLKLIRKYCEDKGIQYWEYGSNISPYIELPSSIDEYLLSLSKKSRWKIKSYRNKLEETRKIGLYETKEKNKIDDDFAVIMQLHQKRWENKGGLGSFAQSKVRFLKFHNSIIHRFFDNGWLYLLQLIVDGIPLAGQYNFIYNNTVYCHSTGFDPDWSEYHVGNVLQLLAVEDLIRKGANEFDLLRGTEQYKYIWAKKEHISIDIAFWRTKKIARRITAERNVRKVARSVIPRTLVDKIYHCIFDRDE
jgi:CelD/BcsL family acetyltransferase involved in cellulose biosynthesis